MPRIPPRLLIQAARISPYLALLLPTCRDLPSARNELRWLTEHIAAAHPGLSAPLQRQRLRALCLRRRAAEPLQYILGTQPFGPLDLKCRPGVLVPRAETEAYTVFLAGWLRRSFRGAHRLRVLDFCTGSGCIPLLLYRELRGTAARLEVRGVDVSPAALALSRENLRHNTRLGAIPAASPAAHISFTPADIFDDAAIVTLCAAGPWHVLVSNPPYISVAAWTDPRLGLSRSTRKYEPRLALIPPADVARSALCAHQDAFYERLLAVARALHSRVVLLEVGDADQARRVLTLLDRNGIAQGPGARVEVWRDWPDVARLQSEEEVLQTQRADGAQWQVTCRGSGNIRSIFVARE